jgi:hypothetical protein
LAVCADAAETPALDPEQIHVRKATWAETMVATRANCADWAKTATEGKLLDTPVVALWRKIAADWPEQAAWFLRDLPWGRHFDWFLQAGNTGFERWIMGLLRPRLGELRGAFQTQADRLNRERIPCEDPRWTTLRRLAERCDDAGPVVHVGKVGQLRAAIAVLEKAFSERFAAAQTEWNAAPNSAARPPGPRSSNEPF